MLLSIKVHSVFTQCVVINTRAETNQLVDQNIIANNFDN